MDDFLKKVTVDGFRMSQNRAFGAGLKNSQGHNAQRLGDTKIQELAF